MVRDTSSYKYKGVKYKGVSVPCYYGLNKFFCAVQRKLIIWERGNKFEFLGGALVRFKQYI